MKNCLLGFVCLSTVLFSCKGKQETVSNTSEPKKTLGKVNTDSTAAPVVIPFAQTAAKLTPVITSIPTTLHENLGKEVITTLSSETGLPLSSYRAVLQDEQGNLWMYTNNELVKYDGNSFYTYKLPVKEFFILFIFIDKQNNIWVAGQVTGFATSGMSQFNIYYFDGYSFYPVPGLQMKFPSNRFLNVGINQGPDKRIWIVNPDKNTILVYDGLQLVKSIDIKANSFKSNYYISFQDNNTIWITDTRDTSLTKYDGAQFIKYTTKDGLPEAYFGSTIPLKDDSLYINTDKGLYLYQNKKSIKIIDSTTSAGLLASGLLADRQNGIWARQTNGKIVKHNSAGNIFFGKEDGIDGAIGFNNDNQDNI